MKVFNNIIEYFQRIRNFAINRMVHPSILEEDSLMYWRVNILISILLTAIVVCTFALATAILLIVKEKAWLLAICEAFAYSICIGLLFFRGLNYETRATVALLMVYFTGLVVILSVGPLSGGPIWLFTFAVLVGVLLGSKAAIGAVMLNGITLAIIGFLISSGHFGQTYPFFRSHQALLAAIVNFLVLNLLAAISVSILVKGVVSSHEKEKVLTKSLEREHGHLVEVKKELEVEVEERKQAEEAVRESEQKYRLLAENVNDMIWLMDIHEQRFSYISPSVKKIRGYTPEEAMEQTLADILTPESYQKAMKVLTDEFAEDTKRNPDRSVTIELEQYHKDGGTIWTETIASFVRDDTKRPIEVLGVTRDITERKEAIQALREKEEKLTRLKKMESLGIMAGGIAHDLNNILSGIVSYPDLLLMDLPGDSPLRQPIQTIRESGHRAAAVVEDLLTIARGVATRKEILSLNTIIEEYMDSSEQRRIETMNPFIVFNTELDPGLLNIRCSESHIKKTLMNIVLNASEAIEDGGTITISTKNRYFDRSLKRYEGEPSGEYVILTVSDDGIGIPSKHIEKIFEPFYTKKMTGRSGTGLGLTVVWNTVQDHDGHINIKSNENGTKFELFIPATREEVNEKKKQMHLANYRGHGENILVIDDEENQRIIACELLTRLGYNPEAVSSGEEAVEYLKENSVDLLLLDMIMPKGIDGHETYNQIIKIHPKQKAVIASGYVETDTVKAAQKLGAGKYIKKPYTLEKLGIIIKEELEK